MLPYPITRQDDYGTLLATSPDYPELTTFGGDRDEAIAIRIHDHNDIARPSRGETFAILPTLTSVKVMLYQSMRDQDVGKAELARRRRWHRPQVDLVLDLQHRSRLEMTEDAPKAIGHQLHVALEVTGNPVVTSPGEETPSLH